MDPYAILGVHRGASREDVKKAFHKLAHQHHPDKGGDAEVFKKISAAYAAVKDIEPPPQPAEPRGWPHAQPMGGFDFSSTGNQFTYKQQDINVTWHVWYGSQ